MDLGKEFEYFGQYIDIRIVYSLKGLFATIYMYLSLFIGSVWTNYNMAWKIRPSLSLSVA